MGDERENDRDIGTGDDADDGCLEPEDLTDEELGRGTPVDPAAVAAWWRRQRERAQRWRHLPDDPLPAQPAVTPAGVGSVVRLVRWRTGASQRDLAAASAVPLSSAIRLEAGSEDGVDVRLGTLTRILATAGLHLAVVDHEGTHLAIPFDQDHFHDHAYRLLPAHRPVYDPRGSSWWGFGLLQQPYPGKPVPTRVFEGRRPRRDCTAHSRDSSGVQPAATGSARADPDGRLGSAGAAPRPS